MLYSSTLKPQQENPAEESKDSMSPDFTEIQQTLSTFNSASSFNQDEFARKKTHLLLKDLIKSLPDKNIQTPMQKKIPYAKGLLELSREYRANNDFADYFFNRAKEVFVSYQNLPTLGF